MLNFDLSYAYAYVCNEVWPYLAHFQPFYLFIYLFFNPLQIYRLHQKQ